MQALFFPLDRSSLLKGEERKNYLQVFVSRYANESETDESQHSHAAIYLVLSPHINIPIIIDALKY